MRVGIDIRALQSPGRIRGTGRYILDLLFALDLVDADIQYVLFHLERRPLPKQVDALGPRFVRAPVSGPAFLEDQLPWYQSSKKLRAMRVLPGMHWRSYLRKSGRLFRSAIRSQAIDVMHFTAPLDATTPPVPQCGVKTIYTFLDGAHLALRSLYYDAWSIPMQRLYRRQIAAFAQADRVVAISEYSRLDAIKFYGSAPDRTETIHCGIPAYDPLGFDAGRIESAKSKFGLTGPYFVFCSVADPHKGFFLLLEAFARYLEENGEGTQLAVIGAQAPRILGEIYQAAFHLGLNSRSLRLTGYVDDQELLDLIKGAEALISPSLYEGFGLPAATAMALGTPVIASDRASLPEVVGDAGLFVDPEDSAGLVRAMRRIATDPGLRVLLREKGLRRVKLFDPKERAEDMIRAYRRAHRM